MYEVTTASDWDSVVAGECLHDRHYNEYIFLSIEIMDSS